MLRVLWRVMLPLTVLLSMQLQHNTCKANVSHPEMSALFDLYVHLRGEHWTWKTESGSGQRWNFTKNHEGEWSQDPCGSPGASEEVWQGVRCAKQESSQENSSIAFLNISSAVECYSTACTVVELDLSPHYNLSGVIPESISQLTGLQHLSLEENAISGSIPSALGSLTRLTYLQLSFNQLVGSIPPELGQLEELGRLGVEANMLTGSIPSELGNLKECYYMDLEVNMLTGPIPPSFSKLANLQVLDLDNTLMSGPLPSEIGLMTGLAYLLLFKNHFTGTLPPELGNLHYLMRFDISGNSFSGSLPEGLGDNMWLSYLSLGENQFTGSIPPSYEGLDSMAVLNLARNDFEGTLPSFANYHNLQRCFLQENKFRGSLGGVFDHSRQPNLVHIDLSENKLTGNLPDSLFKMPSLKTIALSGHLPMSLCEAKKVEVLSMDGLAAAGGCEFTMSVPFTGVRLFNKLGGSIPSCIWPFQELSVLHLTGNGLTGTIGELSTQNRLQELSLSHNLLTGTIPLRVRNVNHLDLSYNKLSGDFRDGVQCTNSSDISLEVNRLSGRLPTTEINRARSSNILMENMFDCETVPEDSNVHGDEYTCGSEMLDTALFMWLTIIFFCFLLLFSIRLASSIMLKAKLHQLSPTLHIRALKQSIYLTFFDHFASPKYLNHPKFQVIKQFTRHLGDTGTLILMLAMGLIFLTLPACLLKIFGKDKYATYEHSYTWVWTLAHLHGVLPASYLVCAWVVFVVLLLYWLPRYYSANRSESMESSSKTLSNETFALMSALFVLNVIIVSAANVAYIYAQHQHVDSDIQFIIKISMAAFKYTVNVIFTPLLCLPIKDRARNITLRLRVFLFNNIFTPCMVTFLTSPSCWQGVLVEANEVTSGYTFDYCTYYVHGDNNTQGCVAWSSMSVDIAPMTPPFDYKYECTSEILTAFVPIYLIVCSLQLLLPFAFVMVFTHIPYESIPHLFRIFIHAVIWPKYWLEDSDEKKEVLKKNPLLLLDSVDIMSMDIVFNLAILLTFGFCSPILALAIGCSCYFKLKMWTLFIGRLTSYITKRETVFVGRDNDDSDAKESPEKDEFPYALSALADVCVSIYAVLDHNLGPLIRTSSVFLSLIVWDIAADVQGWRRGIWAPILMTTVPILCHVVYSYYLDKRRRDDHLTDDRTSGNIELHYHNSVASPLGEVSSQS